eukprot:TRINITY_DN1721_c0_g1_i17.p1 TRINITY_DN1721_c0_g1~~TRINITY_DN1721_c0_g1_i17.p1  ORF type:complete len:113 (-),score=2.97 TRINITY_DN1721_c0_g1_i17:311-649(-)
MGESHEHLASNLKLHVIPKLPKDVLHEEDDEVDKDDTHNNDTNRQRRILVHRPLPYYINHRLQYQLFHYIKENIGVREEEADPVNDLVVNLGGLEFWFNGVRLLYGFFGALL